MEVLFYLLELHNSSFRINNDEWTAPKNLDIGNYEKERVQFLYGKILNRV
jgi:hypothetical protein